MAAKSKTNSKTTTRKPARKTARKTTRKTTATTSGGVRVTARKRKGEWAEVPPGCAPLPEEHVGDFPSRTFVAVEDGPKVPPLAWAVAKHGTGPRRAYVAGQLVRVVVVPLCGDCGTLLGEATRTHAGAGKRYCAECLGRETSAERTIRGGGLAELAVGLESPQARKEREAREREARKLAAEAAEAAETGETASMTQAEVLRAAKAAGISAEIASALADALGVDSD